MAKATKTADGGSDEDRTDRKNLARVFKGIRVRLFFVMRQAVGGALVCGGWCAACRQDMAAVVHDECVVAE